MGGGGVLGGFILMGWVVGGLMGWVVGGSWDGLVCGGVGGGGVHGGVGGQRVHRVGAYTHPPMNSYNVKTFYFMNTHLPIKHIQSVTLSLNIYFGWLMGWVVGGDRMVGGFMGLVSGWWGG